MGSGFLELCVHHSCAFGIRSNNCSLPGNPNRHIMILAQKATCNDYFGLVESQGRAMNVKPLNTIP